MKLNTTLKAICKTYRDIFKADGMVERHELIKMLEVDEDIPDKFKTNEWLNAIADFIERGLGTRELTNERRMNLYKQGLTPYEMAHKEKVDVNSIRYWHRKRNLPYNEKEPAATGK